LLPYPGEKEFRFEMVHLVFAIALIFSAKFLNDRKVPFYILSFLTLFLFSALRYGYGNDYWSYYEGFQSIKLGLPAPVGEDILYKYLNLAMPNFNSLIVFISAFYVIVIYFLIKNNLKKGDYWLAIFILIINPYLFLIHLSALRQVLAILFFVLAVKFLISRNPIPYFALILISSLFHKSAIVLLPIYFVVNTKEISKSFIVLYTIVLYFLVFSPFFNNLLLKILSLDFFPSKYMYYYNQGLRNSLRATLISSYFYFLLAFNIKKFNYENIVYAKLSLIGISFNLLAYQIAMLTRIQMYFDVFFIISFPIIFSNMKNKFYKYFFLIVFIMIYILRYYSFFTNPLWEPFWHYQTILSAPIYKL